MKRFLPVLFFTLIFAHEPKTELPDWKNYYRLGTVNVQFNNLGIASYARLKRTTSHTFQDIRFYGHFFEKDQEIRIRQKTSRRYMSFDKFYSYTTLIYEKNTFIDVDLRYHYNQGLGWLIQNKESGNMTTEIGFAFDNSDYLNTEQKTSYARGGFTVDQKIGTFETKIEFEYFQQISEKNENTDLSRFQILGEIQYSFKKGMSLVCGLTQDIPKGKPFNFETASVFITIALNRPLNWTF